MATDTGIEVEVVKPKPQIGLLGAVSFSLGSMIGSGIFIAPKGALQNAGSVGMSLVLWSLCGFMTLLMGLVYGEIGTLLPHSGGDFIYIRKGLGNLPAFLYVWTIPLFSNTATMAILSLMFADYLLALIFGSCRPPAVMRQTIAALMIVTLCISNLISVKFGEYTQIVCTVAKTLGLLVISVGGIVFLGQGSLDNFQHAFVGSSSDITGYSLAIYSCMFAYMGFNRNGDIAEELKNPRKNIPRAIVISVVAVTIIYVITNISYFVLLPKAEFLSSSAVAYDWAMKAIHPAAFLIPISVMFSVYGSSNGSGFCTGRVMFSAARAGHLPEVMSFLHVRSLVPVVSIVFMHAISVLMLIAGDISVLINFVSFLVFVINLMTTLSLLRMRYLMRKDKEDSKLFKSPIIVPILVIAICLFLIISPFVSNPRIEFVYALALVAFGIVVYIPFVFFELTIPGTNRATIFLQLLCNICPTEKID